MYLNLNLIEKGKSYSITHPEGKIIIGEGCYEKDRKYCNVCSHTECFPINDMLEDTANEILEYVVSEDKLRDVITRVEVIVKTIQILHWFKSKLYF